MSQRIAIIGSCVTRDLWTFAPPLPTDILFFARTSIASIVSKPIAGTIDSEAIDLDNWRKRMVLADVEKHALANLVGFKPTHVILDFIDDRFDLGRVGDCVFSCSLEFKNSGLCQQPPFAEMKPIPRFSDEADNIWASSVDLFSQWMADNLPDTHVIVHDAPWCETYRSADGLGVFKEENEILSGVFTKISGQKALVARYAETIMDAFPKATRCLAPSELHIGDRSHVWGLSPYHYIPEYYADIGEQMRSALNS